MCMLLKKCTLHLAIVKSGMVKYVMADIKLERDTFLLTDWLSFIKKDCVMNCLSVVYLTLLSVT